MYDEFMERKKLAKAKARGVQEAVIVEANVEIVDITGTSYLIIGTSEQS